MVKKQSSAQQSNETREDLPKNEDRSDREGIAQDQGLTMWLQVLRDQSNHMVKAISNFCEVSGQKSPFNLQLSLSDEEKKQWGKLFQESSRQYMKVSALIQERQSQPEEIYHTSMEALGTWDVLARSWGKLMSQPERLMKAQQELMEKQLHLAQAFATSDSQKALPTVVSPEKGDRRFKHPDWEEQYFFSYLKQSYLLNSQWITDLFSMGGEVDKETAQKTNFYVKQILDALAPTNFPLTNPEVIQRTLATKGENLLMGMKKFLQDIEKGKGRLMMPNTKMDYFRLGENLAATPGKVVFQNELMQLIHYAPQQKKSFEIPLFIVPPWINKFYIFDLNSNSFIQYALQNGFSVFIISWVNPDENLSENTFDDYMHTGVLTALERVLSITQAEQAHMISYCLGGMLASYTLAYMAAHQDHRIRCATFLVTLVDFKEAGELTLFMDDRQLGLMFEKMQAKGYMDSRTLPDVFSLLRANSLIWSAYINNYLLNKEFAPFDMLFWNADSVRMSPKVYQFYIDKMYKKNLLVQGFYAEDGTWIDLKNITIPTFFFSTVDDHIAPWHCGYAATQNYGGDVTFTLGKSGHVAGVFNAPWQNKYGYWSSPVDEPGYPQDPDQWHQRAVFTEGSWWGRWCSWATQYAGETVDSIQPGTRSHVIEDAPGSYVRVTDLDWS